ncbi:unnamed protein product [Caenorhabditis auriculariae]|uniref:Uncharacterized protein n=1 Tax=Caenorhabditis auriculariae TaxID=2777116 RepID=A0A8S1GXY8_9PELO|nr:unnamed protein product [Caenorhabditis auriculariae]
MQPISKIDRFAFPRALETIRNIELNLNQFGKVSPHSYSTLALVVSRMLRVFTLLLLATTIFAYPVSNDDFLEEAYGDYYFARPDNFHFIEKSTDLNERKNAGLVLGLGLPLVFEAFKQIFSHLGGHHASPHGHL